MDDKQTRKATFVILGVVYGMLAVTAIVFFMYTKGGWNVKTDASDKPVQVADNTTPGTTAVPDTTVSQVQEPMQTTEPDTQEPTPSDDGPVLIATILNSQPEIDLHGTADPKDFDISIVYSDGTVTKATPDMITVPDEFTSEGFITVTDEDVSLNVEVTVNDLIQSAQHWYADEIASADKVHISDTLLVTETKYETEGQVYWLAHIVCKDPATQVSRSALSIPQTRTLEQAHADEGWVFGLSGSYTNVGGIYSYGMILDEGDLVSSYGKVFSDATIVLKDDGSLTSYPYATLQQVLDDGGKYSFSSNLPTLLPDLGYSKYGCIWCTITAIGQTDTGEYYALLASCNNGTGYVKYSDARNILAECGCTYAKCLSSWGYSAMYLDGYVGTVEETGSQMIPTGDIFVVYD